MGQSVFTYGTLQIPAVMEAVTGQIFISVSAILHDHARFAIKRQVYPGIVPQAGSFVNGCLYFDVDDAALHCLDIFEDVLYERKPIQVACDNGMITTQVYVVCAKYRNLVDTKPWNLEDFTRRHLADYLKSCRRLSAGFARARP